MNELIDLIKEDEGLRLFVYDDKTGKEIVAGTTVVGNPTIGYGRLLTKGNGITHDEANMLLDRDIQTTINELDDTFPWFGLLDSVRSDVVVSIAFNMGVPRFKGFRNTIAAIRDHDWEKAAYEILDSKAARDLPKRYGRLSQMMKTGEY